MSYLHDTHVLLWLLGAPREVPSEVRARLARVREIGAEPLSLSTEAALLAGQLNWEPS